MVITEVRIKLMAAGKEPIASVTPFGQMHGFVEASERRDLAMLLSSGDGLGWNRVVFFQRRWPGATLLTVLFPTNSV